MFDWLKDEMVEEIMMAEDRGEALDKVCEHCPYFSQCCADENFCYGCGAWEAMMGEDL